MRTKNITKRLLVYLLVLSVISSTFNYLDVKASSGYVTSTFRYYGLNGEGSYTCYYSDDYFKNDSTKYNPQLATMSLSLAMSASTSTRYDEETLKNNGNNAKTLLNNIGFDNVCTNEWYHKKQEAYSIAALAGSKKIDDTTLIALAIRGNGYELEWVSNFTNGTKGDHEGFTDAKNKVLDFLKGYVKENNISGKVKLWLTGYSRAAATTNLLAATFDDNENIIDGISVAHNDLFAYCFATPGCGDVNKAGDVEKYNNIFSVLNTNDAIPQFASPSIGITRYGKDYFLPAKESCTRKYDDLCDEMKKILKTMNTIDEKFDYTIDDFSLGMIGTLPIFTGDKRFVINTTQGISVHQILNLAYDYVFINRENTAKTFQPIIMQSFAFLYGLDKDKRSQVESAMKDNLLQNITTIASDKANLLKNVSDTLKKAVNTGIVGFDKEKVYSACDYMAKVATDFFLKHPVECALLINNFNSLVVAHEAECYFAWLASMDTNYNKEVKGQVSNGGYRIVRFNGAVDIKVNDNEGNCATILNSNKVTGDFVAGIDQNGQKYIMLPDNDTYDYTITACQKGNVNINISEYNPSLHNCVRNVNYFDISLQKDSSVTGQLPSFSEDKDVLKGSSVSYVVNDGTKLMVPSSDKKGNDATKKCTIKVKITPQSKANAGNIIGAGYIQYGQFTKLQVEPYDKNEFDGWYKNGKLVSYAKIISVKCVKDETYEARFEEQLKNNKISVTSAYQKIMKTSNQSFNLNAKSTCNSLQFKSNNANVIVDKKGKVTIKKAYIGKATITVTSQKSGYKTVTKKVTITVIPSSTAITRLKNVKTKQVNIRWKKNNYATGYNLQYATKQTFKDAKTQNIANKKITVKNIAKLVKNKTYYFRIRAYKVVNKVKYYSNWSRVKKVVVKK